MWGRLPDLPSQNNNYATTGSFRQTGHVVQVVASVSGVKVTGNKITFNSASRGAVGIYIIDANNAVVSGNTQTGGTQGIGIKAVHRNVTGAQVYNNAIYNIDTTEGDGEAIEFTGWKNTPYRASGSIHHNFIKVVQIRRTGSRRISLRTSCVTTTSSLAQCKMPFIGQVARLVV